MKINYENWVSKGTFKINHNRLDSNLYYLYFKKRQGKTRDALEIRISMPACIKYKYFVYQFAEDGTGVAIQLNNNFGFKIFTPHNGKRHYGYATVKLNEIKKCPIKSEILIKLEKIEGILDETNRPESQIIYFYINSLFTETK